MEYDLLNLLKNRRTVREFSDKRVSEDTIKQILKAGVLAPSSKNKKPVEFIVVRDKEILLKLKECKSKGAEGLNTATCAIVVIADSQLSDIWIEDASIAAILLQLAIEDLGLASVWIQMRKRQSNLGNSEVQIRDLLNIPDNYGVLCLIALGYKKGFKEAYDENDLDFSKVHNEIY
mgnify:CR=1 FL=1